MSHKLRAALATFALVALSVTWSCDGPAGTNCPSKGSIKVKDGQTYHCEKGPSGGLNWQ